MQRLISIFQEPQDDWPAQASVDAPQPDEYVSTSTPETKDPLYFVELMAYVRERNQKTRWPREGAD